MTRRRRTPQDIEDLRGAILDVVGANAPMTVRQVFDQLVGLGLIGRSETEYHNVVVRLLARLRLEGSMPWAWITDGRRWLHKCVR
jgi:hypothetical protein